MSATTPHQTPLVAGTIVADLRRASDPDYALFQAVAGAPPGVAIRVRVGNLRANPFGRDLSYMRNIGLIEVEAGDAQTLASWMEYLKRGFSDAAAVDAREVRRATEGWSDGHRR